mgnify:FL=1
MTEPTRKRIIKELLHIAENSRSKGEVCKAAAEMLKQSQWINVSEKLPDTCADVLIYFDRCGGEVGIDWYNKDKGAWIKNGFMLCYNVTHWMPLPDAPKSEEVK